MTDASEEYATRIDSLLQDEQLTEALEEITGTSWTHPYLRKPIPAHMSLDKIERLRELQRRMVSYGGEFKGEDFALLMGEKIHLGDRAGKIGVSAEEAQRSYASLPRIEMQAAKRS